MDKRELFGQKFIYFILTLWFGTEVLFNSTVERVLFWKTSELNEAMAVIVLALLVIQIVFFQKYQFQELLLISIISAPIILATLNSNHNKMISTWIFIVAVKHMDFDKIVRLSYYVELVVTAIVFYMFASDFITEVTIFRGDVLRHSLGFSHPNQLGIRIFLLVVSRCYIRRDRFNFIDWGIIIGAAAFVNRVANSKTSYYALVILACITLFDFIIKKLGMDHDTISDLLILVALGANAMSLILSFIRVKQIPIINAFDIFMSKRFSQCHRTLQYYGIKLFGQEIQLIVNRPEIGRYYRFWLDNAYMSILLRYGPIVLIFFSSLYIFTMVMLKDMKEYILIEILCLYAIYGIMENNFFSMSQNLFLLLLSYPLYKHDVQKDIVEKRREHRRVKLTW